MRRFLWAIPAAFFFLNPGFACGPGESEPQFNYGAAEMRAAVEGTWSFTILPEGATTSLQVMVRISQAATAPGATATAPGRSLVRAAYACGGRTLVKSADACIDWTQMPLEVAFLSGDASFANAAMTGTFLVNGTEFQAANTMLELVIGDFKIGAQIGPGGTFTNAHIEPTGARGNLMIVTRI